MRRSLLAWMVAAFVMVTAGNALATAYQFEDVIDKWRPFRLFDAAQIVEGAPLSYTHDINDSVNFAAGDTVLDAQLQLDFTNDANDNITRVFGTIIWDNREFTRVAYDGAGWVDLGEVDNGQYPIVLDIDWLNDDGLLDVTISVNNSCTLNPATAWLDESRLTGHAEPANLQAGNTVPEPLTVLGLLASAGGIGAYIRRRQVA